MTQHEDNNNNYNNIQIGTCQCSINQLRYSELQSMDSLNKSIAES